MDLSVYEVGGILRVVISLAWLASAGIYFYAYKKETVKFLRPMRLYGALVSLGWFLAFMWTGLGLMFNWPFPRSVELGLLTATLMFPTAAYFMASGWVTHKIVRSWE